MKKPIFLILLLLFSFSLFSKDYSYQIFMMGVPIGKSVDRWNKRVDSNGNCELWLNSTSKMSLERGGNSVQMSSNTVLSVDCASFAPKKIDAVTSELASEIRAAGTVDNGLFYAEITKNGNKESFSYALKSGVTFFSLIFKKFSAEEFLKGGTAKIISEESLVESEISFSAVRISDDAIRATVNYQGIPMSYIVSNGEVVRSEIQNGLLVYQLENSAAPVFNRQEKSSADILQNSMRINMGIRVANPRKSQKTTFVLKGEPAKSLPVTCFQKIEGDKLFVDNSNQNCKNRPESADTLPNLFEDGNDPAIIKTARKIALGSPNKNETIKRAVNFVYREIKDKNYKHGTLSASEVLKQKSGDCTEHSTLLAALLRSLNIPVKMVYGLVLDSQGRFFFHNWNEVLSDSGWVSVDSTFNMERADSSRITLTYGGNDSRSREEVSLTVLRFLNKMEIFVSGFSNE